MKKLFIALMVAGVLVAVDAGAATRRACPAGTYSKAGAKSLADCIKCSTLGEKRYSDAEGSSTCRICPTGQVANANGTGCEAGCKENQLRGTNSQGKLTCRACPTGAICDGTSAFTCKDGFYKTDNECAKCPAHAATCTATSFTCEAGYYENNKACKQCDAGYYCG